MRSKSRSQPAPAPSPKEPARAPETDPDNPSSPKTTGPTAAKDGPGAAASQLNVDVKDDATIKDVRRRSRILGAASQQMGL